MLLDMYKLYTVNCKRLYTCVDVLIVVLVLSLLWVVGQRRMGDVIRVQGCPRKTGTSNRT